MRPFAVALVAASAVLAGCLGGDGKGPAPTPAPSGTGSGGVGTDEPVPPPPQVLDLLLAFEFTGCSGLSVRHARPLEDVQALLPAGFTAAPAPDSPSADVGILAVDLFVCGNLTTAAVAVPDTYVGLVYTYIARPVDRVPGAPDSAVQEYVFRLLAGQDVLAMLWPAAGYHTYSGPANVTVGPPLDGPDPLLRFGQASVGPLGEGYFLVASGLTLAAVPAGRTQSFARYTTHVDDDSVLLWTGTYDFPASAAGPGFVELEAGDPFAAYAPPEGEMMPGTALQYDGGAVRGQDLRRIFTSAD